MPYLSTFIDGAVEKQLIREYEKQLTMGHISPAEIIIHKDTAGVYKRLAEGGIITLYYTPTPQKGVFVVWKNVDSSIIFGKKRIKFTQGCPSVANRLRKKASEIEKYNIPLEKIDDVFDLINKGAQPREIVDVLITN